MTLVRRPSKTLAHNLGKALQPQQMVRQVAEFFFLFLLFLGSSPDLQVTLRRHMKMVVLVRFSPFKFATGTSRWSHHSLKKLLLLLFLVENSVEG